MINLSNFYIYSIKPRYDNLYGMELYSFYVDFHDEVLKEPYGDYSKGIFRENEYDFDENGVFTFKNHDEIKYNPCGVAEFALISFEKYINSKEEKSKHLNKFNQQLKWLEENVTIEKEFAIWYYHYDDIKPFYSGISQGMIISVLLRAYQINKQEKYLDLALKAYNFLVKPVSDGGLLSIEENYKYWFEEYIDHRKILNGHIYSMLGVWDLYRVTKDEKIKDSFDKAALDIKNNIGDFDLGFFTTYSASSKQPANNSYHYTHITLFYILFKITNDPFFKNYADKFMRYHQSIFYKTINFFYILFLVLQNKLNRK